MNREVALDVDRRAGHVDVEPERDVDVDAAEEQPDRDAHPRLGIHGDVEEEGVEEDDAVAAEVERRVGRAEVGGDVHPGARHDRLGAEGEVDPAGDADGVCRLPGQPDPGHERVAVVLEPRVVAADRDDELPGVRPLPPGLEREAAGEPHRLLEQPGVLGELRLDEQQALLGGEARQEGELDRDQRERRVGQLRPGQAEDRHLEPVAELDRDEDLAGDQDEAGEADPGGDPVLALRRLDVVAQVLQLLHRVLGRTARAQRQHERVAVDLVDGRGVQLAVDAEADTDAGHEEGRDPAERSVQDAEREERRELRATGRGRVRVAAEQVDAVDAVADLQHPQVLHADERRVEIELRQPTGQRQGPEARRDGEPGDVDLPGRRVEQRSGDVVAQPQLVDGGGQPQQRDLPVEEEADHLDLAGREVLLVGHAEPDLLQVDRTERPLDRQEPRPVTTAGAQRDGSSGAVVLHRDGRAEGRPRRRPAATRVVHDALRHGVVAPAATQRHGEPAELDLDAAGDIRLSVGAQDDAAEHVQGHRLQLQARIDQRPAGLAQAQPDAVHGDTGRRHQVRTADPQQVQDDAR